MLFGLFQPQSNAAPVLQASLPLALPIPSFVGTIPHLGAVAVQPSSAASSHGDVFVHDSITDALNLGGLAPWLRGVHVGNLSDLATLAERLPGGLGQPDLTGEVPTGSHAIPREQVAVDATLAAAPRIIGTLGPTSETVSVRGEDFDVTRIYADPDTGFLAVHLTPLVGGPEVFAIDGLQVGSHADEVAAATLGRLQLGSPQFAAMVADAAAVGQANGQDVVFTGPSLGGAIAEAAAYETAEAIHRSGRPAVTGDVQLVTVDGLGGRDATESINGGTLDPAVLNLITALNIRTEGDIVSRIGSHIGSTLTLPALDRAGNPVTLDAADAHVNIVSLMQNLSSDARFAQGVVGPPAEISAFAAASNAASAEAIRVWKASGAHDDATPDPLQIPGTAHFDATGTVWSLDADDNGTTDIAVTLSTPATQATRDLVL